MGRAKAKLRALRPVGMPVAGGALLALAFPPFELMAVAFVALAPLLLSLRAAAPGFWAGFRRGYVFGFVFGLINLFWLHQFVAKWTGSIWMGAVPWLVVTALFSVYFGLFGGAAAKAWGRGCPWAIPLIWAGVEALRSLLPVVYFPWALLGSSLYKLPALMQSASWGGPYFLSAWMALFSVIAAMMLSAGSPPWAGEGAGGDGRAVWRYIAVALAVMAGSILAYFSPIEGRRAVIAAVQPGVDLAFDERGRPKGREQADRELARAVPGALRVGAAVRRDLVVLPEGVSSGDGQSPPEAPFKVDLSAPLLMGGQRRTSAGTYQSVFAYDGRWQYADKVRLVIFGEYVPFRERLKFLEGFNLPQGDLREGERVATLRVGRIRVGGLVCFESLFEDVARVHAANGAELLAVLSLDDWYQGTGAISHLKAVTVLRAVENRLPVVRSAPLGPSMIVDARGNILSEARIGDTTAVQHEVLVAPSPPALLRHAFPWVGIAIWALFAFWPPRPRTTP